MVAKNGLKIKSSKATVAALSNLSKIQEMESLNKNVLKKRPKMKRRKKKLKKTHIHQALKS